MEADSMSELPWYDEMPERALCTSSGEYRVYGGRWYGPKDIEDLREMAAVRRALSEMCDDMRSRYIETVRAIDCRLHSVLKRNGKV
jgi:hypothetical protein